MDFKRLQSVYKKNNSQILPVKPGMSLEIHETVGEGSSKRTWKFKCLVIKVKNPQHPNGTFIVRGESAGNTIEKIYPLSFPKFKKVILLDMYKVRRSKLYFIRDKVGKGARMKSIISTKDRNKDLLTELIILDDSQDVGEPQTKLEGTKNEIKKDAENKVKKEKMEIKEKEKKIEVEKVELEIKNEVLKGEKVEENIKNDIKAEVEEGTKTKEVDTKEGPKGNENKKTG